MAKLIRLSNEIRKDVNLIGIKSDYEICLINRHSIHRKGGQKLFCFKFGVFNPFKYGDCYIVHTLD